MTSNFSRLWLRKKLCLNSIFFFAGFLLHLLCYQLYFGEDGF